MTNVKIVWDWYYNDEHRGTCDLSVQAERKLLDAIKRYSLADIEFLDDLVTVEIRGYYDSTYYYFTQLMADDDDQDGGYAMSVCERQVR